MFSKLIGIYTSHKINKIDITVDFYAERLKTLNTNIHYMFLLSWLKSNSMI